MRQVFERIFERVAGLDVHKAQVTAAVRVPDSRGGRLQDVAEFKTTVQGLLACWLTAHGVTHVAMEATGVYWKPVWAVLEDDVELLLVNARHVKQVPGRKTDVSDAAWLAQLLEAGLLRASFVPPKPIRALRNLTRYRKTQIEERQREANRLHKILEDTGIKLDCVAWDILGASGRAMLNALVSGTTDPAVLAELAKGRLRTKIPALQEALEGRFDALHALIVSSILARLDFLDEAIDRLSDAIEEQLVPFAPAVELLCTIPGIQKRTAQVILAEIGPDMSIFPTAKHLASWAGQCPGNDRSAGKRRSADPQGIALAGDRVDRGGAGRDAHQEHLPRRALPAAQATARPQARAGRRQALDAHRDLAHAQHRRAVQRARPRPLHPRPRPHHQAPPRPTRGARPARHAAGGRSLIPT